MAKNVKRGKNKDNARRSKKKISILSSEKIEYVDYKDVDLLKRFMSDRAKIKSRRVNGNDVQQQRVIAKAVKNSREMGLLPYTNRVTTQRRGRSDRDRVHDGLGGGRLCPRRHEQHAPRGHGGDQQPDRGHPGLGDEPAELGRAEKGLRYDPRSG